MEEKERDVVDVFQEETITEIERLKKILNESNVSSEEYKNADRKMTELLKELNAFYRNSNEYYAREEDRRIAEKHNDDMVALESEKLKNHKDIEESRAASQLEVEKLKQTVPWQKAAFEIAKLVVPALITGGISAATFFEGQKRMIKFEETGRFTSSVSRESHLPRIFK